MRRPSLRVILVTMLAGAAGVLLQWSAWGGFAELSPSRMLTLPVAILLGPWHGIAATLIGTVYNDGLNQLDLRFAKIFRFGSTQTTINFDIYNATNSNTILTLNNGFVTTTTPATWLLPTAILQPRFWKIGAQFDS